MALACAPTSRGPKYPPYLAGLHLALAAYAPPASDEPGAPSLHERVEAGLIRYERRC